MQAAASPTSVEVARLGAHDHAELDLPVGLRGPTRDQHRVVGTHDGGRILQEDHRFDGRLCTCLLVRGRGSSARCTPPSRAGRSAPPPAGARRPPRPEAGPARSRDARPRGTPGRGRSRRRRRSADAGRRGPGPCTQPGSRGRAHRAGGSACRSPPRRSRRRAHLCTRAPAPRTKASTSARLAIEVSPGVVMARAPCAAPYSTAVCEVSAGQQRVDEAGGEAVATTDPVEDLEVVALGGPHQAVLGRPGERAPVVPARACARPERHRRDPQLRQVSGDGGEHRGVGLGSELGQVRRTRPRRRTRARR